MGCVPLGLSRRRRVGGSGGIRQDGFGFGFGGSCCGRGMFRGNAIGRGLLRGNAIGFGCHQDVGGGGSVRGPLRGTGLRCTAVVRQACRLGADTFRGRGGGALALGGRRGPQHKTGADNYSDGNEAPRYGKPAPAAAPASVLNAGASGIGGANGRAGKRRKKVTHDFHEANRPVLSTGPFLLDNPRAGLRTGAVTIMQRTYRPHLTRRSAPDEALGVLEPKPSDRLSVRFDASDHPKSALGAGAFGPRVLERVRSAPADGEG